MKYIFTLLFLTCSLSAFCQTTTKKFVIQPDNITYFEVIRVTNPDGTYQETGNSVGPASAIVNYQVASITGKANVLAQAAYDVSLTKQAISDIGTIDSLSISITGISALKSIQDLYQSALLKPGWTIDQGAGLGFQPLVFTINGSGVLKYSINGAATKNATIYGSIIHLASFPSTGTNTDFFIDESGKKYFSLPNRGVIIKLP